MLPANRVPTHPGEVIDEEFLKPLGMTQTELADKLDMSVNQLNPIVRGHRSVSATTALLLARAFDTTPQFWMNLQRDFDLWNAQKKLKAG